jgi:hypothetical protein
VQISSAASVFTEPGSRSPTSPPPRRPPQTWRPLTLGRYPHSTPGDGRTARKHPADMRRLRWFSVGGPTTQGRTKLQVTRWARWVSNPRLSCLVSGALDRSPGNMRLCRCPMAHVDAYVARSTLAGRWQPQPHGRDAWASG